MHEFFDTRRMIDPYKDYDYGNNGYPGEFVYGDYMYVPEDYMDELWKPVVGFEGFYWVSDMGRVWSCKNEQFLTIKPLDKHGHMGVCLYVNGIRYYRYIHRLVAEAFIPNPHNHTLVRHSLDIPSFNTTSDLKWGTQRDNMLDAIRNGRSYALTDEDRQKGRDIVSTPIIATNLRTGERSIFVSQSEASRVLRIPQANIWKVLNGRRPRAQGYTFEYANRGCRVNDCY